LSQDLGSDSEKSESLIDLEKKKKLQKNGSYARVNSIQGMLKHLRLN
jgi:hypothetical protein